MKTIERKASFVISAEENCRQAFEVTETRTSKLVNLVFSRQTGIQSASIHFRLINRWSKPMSPLYKCTAIKPGFETVSKQQAAHARSLLID